MSKGNGEVVSGRKSGLDASIARELLPDPERMAVGVTGDIAEVESARFGRLRTIACRTPQGVAVERVILATWAVSPRKTPDPNEERLLRILRGSLES